ncbi:B12-binding domain-containing radical SAM protein [Candidatus Xianfuyuplasma coldseepsis]|uniref:B12-binding domain-containing radical SAM protein n=1 Tax=Candidatus Xianfuyuplasma coldseepsis TaxID=2782163 RepID=A0A7L7KQ96_9MOLU|nr:radical SAM protein [Xianfuyuplasma coldseepsis]QMS84755.1 B12-binding domain-containing radical SAM protein [Xianfuyuplasma coldseepsis]
MNILLISIDAKFIHTNNAVRLLKANSTFPIEIREFTIKDRITTIEKTIRQRKWDVIGFSVYIWNVELVKQLLIRVENTSKTIILGGPEVSYDPEHFLQYRAVEVIVRGEGELVFDRLLQRLQHNKPYEDLPNIAYRKQGEIIKKPIEEIQHLNSLEAPYYFEDDIANIPNRITYIESSRGCPYHCSYCLSSLEKSVRFFPVEGVKRAITYAMKHGSQTIKFLDRTFNANRHTLDILDHIIHEDNGRTVFQFEITGEVLSPKIIEYIHNYARPGLFRFEIGIQSTNETTNHLVDRHQNTPQLFDRIRQIQQGGIIDLHLDLIAGLPQEDLASFKKTFDEVFFLGAKELQLGFLKMLRGTKIRLFADLYHYKYHEQAPYEIIENNVLSKRNINEIKHVEHMLEMHHNKGYFGDNLHQYILSQPSPYAFFKKLYAHYKKHKFKQHGYQLVDVYNNLLLFLPEDHHYSILQDYLLRSKIKPQIFFTQSLTKKERNMVLQQVHNITNIPLHKLYKHSVILKGKSEYFVAYYEDQNCISYKVKAPE